MVDWWKCNVYMPAYSLLQIVHSSTSHQILYTYIVSGDRKHFLCRYPKNVPLLSAMIKTKHSFDLGEFWGKCKFTFLDERIYTTLISVQMAAS